MADENSENLADPRIIDFTLSRWEKDDHVVYIGKCNGVYYGCLAGSGDITPEDIAKEIFDIDITTEVLNSRLTRFTRILKGHETVFYVSVVRSEVTYVIPGRK